MYKIYAIFEPNTTEIKFVGATELSLSQVSERHKGRARHKEKRGNGTDFTFWLIRIHGDPTISLLEETEDKSRKYYWIKKFIDEGHKLLNEKTKIPWPIAKFFDPDKLKPIKVIEPAKLKPAKVIEQDIANQRIWI